LIGGGARGLDLGVVDAVVVVSEEQLRGLASDDDGRVGGRRLERKARGDRRKREGSPEPHERFSFECPSARRGGAVPDEPVSPAARGRTPSVRRCLGTG